MHDECEKKAVVRTRRRVTVAAASALLTMVALAGCAATSGGDASPTPANSPSASSSTVQMPPPTPDPLIIPGCERLLPLASAKSLFSDATEAFGEEDSAPFRDHEIPEVEVVASNAAVAKYCIWGVPNSDGGFSLTVGSITDTDAANLSAALLSAGYLSATSGTATTFENSSEGELGSIALTHYLVGDVWIFVHGTSTYLTTEVADSALAEIRAANPDRSL